MRPWRRSQPQGPSTGTRFAATAARMRRRATKKKVVKIVMLTGIVHRGRTETPNWWRRYQTTPVTWNGPSRRRTQPPSGACGGRSGAAARTLRPSGGQDRRGAGRGLPAPSASIAGSTRRLASRQKTTPRATITPAFAEAGHARRLEAAEAGGGGQGGERQRHARALDRAGHSARQAVAASRPRRPRGRRRCRRAPAAWRCRAGRWRGPASPQTPKVHRQPEAERQGGEQRLVRPAPEGEPRGPPPRSARGDRGEPDQVARPPGPGAPPPPAAPRPRSPAPGSPARPRSRQRRGRRPGRPAPGRRPHVDGDRPARRAAFRGAPAPTSSVGHAGGGGAPGSSPRPSARSAASAARSARRRRPAARAPARGRRRRARRGRPARRRRRSAERRAADPPVRRGGDLGPRLPSAPTSDRRAHRRRAVERVVEVARRGRPSSWCRGRGRSCSTSSRSARADSGSAGRRVRRSESSDEPGRPAGGGEREQRARRRGRPAAGAWRSAPARRSPADQSRRQRTVAPPRTAPRGGKKAASAAPRVAVAASDREDADRQHLPELAQRPEVGEARGRRAPRRWSSVAASDRRPGLAQGADERRPPALAARAGAAGSGPRRGCRSRPPSRGGWR